MFFVWCSFEKILQKVRRFFQNSKQYCWCSLNLPSWIDIESDLWQVENVYITFNIDLHFPLNDPYINWGFWWLKCLLFVIICHRGSYPIREDLLSFRIVFRRKKMFQIRWLRTNQLIIRKKGRNRGSSSEIWSVIKVKVYFWLYEYLYYLLIVWRLSAGEGWWSTLTRPRKAWRMRKTMKIHFPIKKPNHLKSLVSAVLFSSSCVVYELIVLIQHFWKNKNNCLLSVTIKSL